MDTRSNEGTHSTAFAYDPLGRRIAKTHQRTDRTDERPHHTRFHWDGLRLLQEEDRLTNTLYLYTDQDSYEPLARVETDLRPLLSEPDHKTPWAGQAAAPDIQSIALGPPLPDDLPSTPTAAGGKDHWGALTKTNRTTLPTRLFYFHTDLNGAPEELTDINGEVTWRLTSKVWGSTIHEEQTSPLTHQNLRFQGQYLDRETGSLS